MLDLDGGHSCRPRGGVSRRDFLKVGALSVAGLALPDLLRPEAAHAAGAPASAGKRAKNVLLIYLGGGMTHLDTLDPKPDAPREIRGKYGVIRTGIPGVRYTEQMPELARCTDLYALVRSQVTGSDHHETAAQWMLTGNYGAMQGGDHPSIGAIVSHAMGPIDSLPASVSVPRNHALAWELGKAAWLGEQHESLAAGDPRQAAARAPHQGLSAEARKAFDLSREPDTIKDLYGRNEGWGAKALLARRLIESGARFVLLSYDNWDCHARLYESCDAQLPLFDRAIAALLRDMKQRGLLEETLVAMYGDFGRAPRINLEGGRDHWAHAGVMLFAGPGIRTDQVIGATDARGEYVLERPVRPPEVAATIYDALGIDYRKSLMTPSGRPVAILPPETEILHELYS